MHKKSILTASNLAYELATTRTLFKGITIGINEGDRIGLVGRNGIGKSTFLKILANQISPSSGVVMRSSTVDYLPQLSNIRQEAQGDTVLNLLSSTSDEWWTVSSTLEENLETDIDLSLPVSSLSGGELTKLFLAIALSKNPSILLLDEPTNHLDFLALECLRTLLYEFTGAFVIVSHKPFFLDQVVDTIWELTADELKVYGGNYSFYREQKEIEHQMAWRVHEVAKKELKQVKDAALKEQKRAARSRREGRIQAQDRSMSRMERRFFANKASASAGSAFKKNDAAVSKAKQALEATKIKTNKATQINLQEVIRKKKSLIDIQDARLKRGNNCLIENITLRLSMGDRVAISGSNGSGKSSLIKAILGIEKDATPALLDSGEILISQDIKAVYLDQTYELVDRSKTILENLQAANSSLEYQLLRQQLGHFLFFRDDVHKSAAVLSGGELARLAIAMISISEIELLVLDEPTNNLDQETVNQIIEGLNDYQGSVWVISHDLDFLSRISITQAFKLQECQLQATVHLPDDPEQYHQELLYSELAPVVESE